MIGNVNYGESGIYIIQSQVKPERVYVGSAVNLKRRKWEHTSYLRKKNHHSHKLQHHFDKYGESDLIFEVIESGDYLDKNHILSREQGWFNHFGFKTGGLPFFNECSNAGSNLGIKQSPETRKKKSDLMKGTKRAPKTQEQKDHQSKMLKGRPLSQEHKDKLKGKVISEAHRASLRIKMKGNKNGIGNKGNKTHSWNRGLRYETSRKKLEVVQLDLLGNQIMVWESAKRAALSVGVCTGTITSACNDNPKCRKVKGFLWKYKKDLL